MQAGTGRSRWGLGRVSERAKLRPGPVTTFWPALRYPLSAEPNCIWCPNTHFHTRQPLSLPKPLPFCVPLPRVHKCPTCSQAIVRCELGAFDMEYMPPDQPVVRDTPDQLVVQDMDMELEVMEVEEVQEDWAAPEAHGEEVTPCFSGSLLIATVVWGLGKGFGRRAHQCGSDYIWLRPRALNPAALANSWFRWPCCQRKFRQQQRYRSSTCCSR